MYNEAQKKATAKYNAKAYEEIKVRVKAGEKAPIKTAADAAGISTNDFIVQAINEKMGRSS